MNTAAKPFMKWAGGKGQLLSQLDTYLPENLSEHDFMYIEPFVGGGAMLFHMLQRFPNIRKVIINDINSHLVTAYRVIKDQPEQLITKLSELEAHYFALAGEDAKKSYFLQMRDVFNKEDLNDIDRVKLLLFLNRTCFNGLYRVNGKGFYNVPFGRNLHPTICNAETIRADSELLNSREVVILNGDYTQTLAYIDNGPCFYYFDPPYRPLNATSSFTSYAKENFNDAEQIRLRDFCKQISERQNIRWMLSNADCSSKNPNDTFFEEHYAAFHIHRVYASRAINADASKRGKLTELLIKNYE